MNKALFVAINIVLVIVLLEVGLTIGGITNKYLQTKTEKGNKETVLVIGDSVSVGQNNWVDQLRQELNQKYDVVNEAQCGKTSDMFAAEIGQLIQKYRPTIVVSMIGITDKPIKEKESFVLIKKMKTYKLIVAAIDVAKKKLEQQLPQKRQEQKLINQVQQDPTNPDQNIKLINFYIDTGQTQKTEASLTNLVKNTKPSKEAYLLLAYTQNQNLKHEEAAKTLITALKTFPGNTNLTLELGRTYNLLQKFWETEQLLSPMRTLSNESPYYDDKTILADALVHLNKTDEAILIYEEVRNTNLNKQILYLDIKEKLIDLYVQKGRFGEAYALSKNLFLNHPELEAAARGVGATYIQTNMSKEAIPLFLVSINKTSNPASYTELLWYSIYTNQTSTAQQLIREIANLNNSEAIYEEIGMRYLKMGDKEEAQNMFDLVEKNRIKRLSIGTSKYYNQIRDELKQEGIVLVAMQYPTLPLDILRNMFVDKEGIIFVGNEEDFKEAVEEQGYDALFVDHFHGQFGHCTDLCANMISQKVAQKILETEGGN